MPITETKMHHVILPIAGRVYAILQRAGDERHFALMDVETHQIVAQGWAGDLPKVLAGLLVDANEEDQRHDHAIDRQHERSYRTVSLN